MRVLFCSATCHTERFPLSLITPRNRETKQCLWIIMFTMFHSIVPTMWHCLLRKRLNVITKSKRVTFQSGWRHDTVKRCDAPSILKRFWKTGHSTAHLEKRLGHRCRQAHHSRMLLDDARFRQLLFAKDIFQLAGRATLKNINHHRGTNTGWMPTKWVIKIGDFAKGCSYLQYWMKEILPIHMNWFQSNFIAEWLYLYVSLKFFLVARDTRGCTVWMVFELWDLLSHVLRSV